MNTELKEAEKILEEAWSDYLDLLVGEFREKELVGLSKLVEKRDFKETGKFSDLQDKLNEGVR